MLTMGAPASSTESRHSCRLSLSLMLEEYSRMRPQPVQVRLQACSGSSMSTIGKRLLIMGCGCREAASAVFMGRIRKGFDALGAGAAFFCHSGRGCILFLKMYPAMPALIESGK